MPSTELPDFVDAARDAIVVIDERSRVAAMNAAAERLFGRSRADAVGKDVALVIGPARDSPSQRAALLLKANLSEVGRFNLLGEMAAGIAHELNQPLSAIASYAQAGKRILEREQPQMRTVIDVCS